MKEEESRRAVNPAARHDKPGEAPAGERREEERPKRQVEPVQREPLDPLNPGGIGS